jgi:hypothetical protein
MITAIEIENFKAIGERVRVELKPLTLIFGPNSAGKSTIIQALHCAREIFERHNLDPDRTVSGGAAVDLGGFWNVVHKHEANRPIRLRVDVATKSLPDYESDELGFKPSPFGDDEWSAAMDSMFERCRSAWAEVAACWMEPIGAALLFLYQAGVNGKLLARTGVSADVDSSEVQYINLDHPILAGGIRQIPDLSLHQEFRPLRQLFGDTEIPRGKDLAIRFASQRDRSGWPSALPVWGEVLRIDEDVLRGAGLPQRFSMLFALSRMIVGPGETIRNELRSLRYLGPIREMPERNYVPPRLPDKQRWATGLGAWDRLHEADQEFIARVNGWLSRLKCGYTVRLREYREVDQGTIPAGDASEGDWKQFRENVEKQPLKRRVVLVADGQSIEVLPNDVGIGISQLLPAVVLALDADEGIVAIEQPEIHLHPALQTELGDLFIEAALGKGDEKQRKRTLIVETHSEHLILRLLRRIRETTEGKLLPDAIPLRPEDVSVIYVEQTDKGAKVCKLRIDESGEFIDRWPKGFFEERADELF